MSFHIHIQPNSGVPLYRQIANEVKAAFLSKRLKSGERLPSVRELAAELGMNPTTIVKAYDLLENERLIVRRQGQGAFAADGRQPIEDTERLELIQRLAAQLAIEGRRLGLDEAAIEDALRVELEKLRPASAPRPKRKNTRRKS